MSKILSLGTGFFARVPPVAPFTVMIGSAMELDYSYAYRGYVAYALGLAYGHVSMARGQWDKMYQGWEHPMVAKRETDWTTGMRKAAAYYTGLARRGSDGSQMALRKLRAIRRLGPNVALNLIWRKVITQVGLKGRQLRRWKAYKLYWPKGYK